MNPKTVCLYNKANGSPSPESSKFQLLRGMDPEAFTASLFKWDPRGVVPPQTRMLEPVAPPPVPLSAATAFSVVRPRELGGLEELFQAYGIRYYTAAKIAELGFTVNTLVDMKDEELDEMMNSLSQIFRWELLVGERYGIKAAVRAERRRIDEEDSRRRHILSGDTTNAVDALSQEGMLSFQLSATISYVNLIFVLVLHFKIFCKNGKRTLKWTGLILFFI